MTELLSLQPFIPGGADFAKSQELFGALGFEQQWEASGLVGFRRGAAKFILQDFNDKAFAENLMMKLDVADLDAWWQEVEPLDLPSRFPGFRITPPKNVPWGREVSFIDLAGVCWHVAAP